MLTRDTSNSWYAGAQLTSSALVVSTVGGWVATSVHGFASLVHDLVTIGQGVVTLIALYMSIRGLMHIHPNLFHSPKPPPRRRARKARA
jgi:hypothetical protein